MRRQEERDRGGGGGFGAAAAPALPAAHTESHAAGDPRRWAGRKHATWVGYIRSSARAPAGARADLLLQARAAIASTSFHFGKRPFAFFE